MPTPTPRWKLLIILMALPIVLLTVFRLSPLGDSHLGGAVSILAIILQLVLLLVWLLLLSRLRWGLRLFGLVLIAVLGAGLRYSVRIEGHLGNFFPHFAWAWSPRSDELADALVATGTTPGVALTTALPSDFSRFLGPTGDNWVSGALLAADWYRQTPRELWRRDIGLGWSSFSVAGPYAFTMEQRGGAELTVCYEARTGQPIWVHEEKVRFSESMGGDGPRSTPTIHDGKVYALGATGILLCLDGLTGEVKWRRDTLAETGQANLQWAKSSSPLIADDTVVITLGDSKDGALAAYDLLTGEARWRAGQDRSSYATPVLAALAGRRQIVVLNGGSVSGHHVRDGSLLWTHEVGRAPAHAASPVIAGSHQVLVGIGYGRGTWLLQIQNDGDRQVSQEVWRSHKMRPKFNDMVLRDGYLYGIHEGRGGYLVCLNLADGRPAWRGNRVKHGQVLGVGDKLIVQAEGGHIVIADANPDKEHILHRFPALSSKTWNHPVLAGRLLLLRNDREAVVFEYPGNDSNVSP